MSADVLTLGRLRDFGATGRLPLLASIGCSAVYFAAQGWQPYPGSFIIKGACNGIE